MPLIPTITDAAAAMRAGMLDPVELTNRCLRQIERLDGKLKAWVVVDRNGALQAAAESAERIRAGRSLSKLDGIPIGVKDLIYTMGMRTRAGSPILAARYAAETDWPLIDGDSGPVPENATIMIRPEDQDATVVEKLRLAGAIILGKTVTTEYACFDPAPTKNPWKLDRTPGGSSAGSAAAVAAGMCCAALASQTGGSITRPASFCGVCGLKPTYGRVSVHGAIPVAFSLDHVGAIARSVSDLGIILAATAGHDPHDALSSAAAVPRGLASIVPALQPPSFNFGRGGLQTDAQPAASTAMDRAMALFKAAGASVRADFEFDLPLVVKMHRRIMAVEAAQYHREQYAARKSEYGRNIAALLEEGLALPAIDYAEARRFQLELRHWATIELAAGEFLLTPATVGPAPGADTTGDPRFNSPWSFIGFPTVNIPCGLSPEGLPIGLQIVGRPWEEDKLLSAAAWCERVLGFSAVPGMVRD